MADVSVSRSIKRQWHDSVLALAELEARHFKSAFKHLGATLDLVPDVDSLYSELLDSMQPPPHVGDDLPDGVLAFWSIHTEIRLCQMLVHKSVIAAMRGYLGDSLMNLRRSIEAAAFAFRISKHTDLARIWANGGMQSKNDEDEQYRAYRKAFRPVDVFPNTNHQDGDPILSQLKTTFDLCSRPQHGSIVAVAGHFQAGAQGPPDPFDMPRDSTVTAFIQVIAAHVMILKLFRQATALYVGDAGAWDNKHGFLAERVQRHTQKWIPHIANVHNARNRKK